MTRLSFVAALAAAAIGLTAPAIADNYPSRTVTLVVPYPGGGSVDGVARILAQKLGETFKPRSLWRTVRAAPPARSAPMPSPRQSRTVTHCC